MSARTIVRVGGHLPGTVRWIDDAAAYVACDGHHVPDVVYAAACHDGADLDDVVCVPLDSLAGVYVVAPAGHPCLDAYLRGEDGAL